MELLFELTFMEWFLLYVLTFLAILGLLEGGHAQQRRRGQKEGIIFTPPSPSRSQIVDDIYILDQPAGPRKIMRLMTTKEVMDILEREPKFDVVLDMRPFVRDPFDIDDETRAEREKNDKKARRMLERMTREEILSVLQRGEARPTTEEKRDSLALIDAILKVRDHRTVGRTDDAESAVLMDEARNALDRCSVRTDSERIVKRLAAAILDAWTDRPGRRRAESSRSDQVVTAALDILERRTRGKSDSSVYERRVAASLEALNNETPPTPPHKAG